MSLTIQFAVVFCMGFFFGVGTLISVGYLLGERQRRIKAQALLDDFKTRKS